MYRLTSKVRIGDYSLSSVSEVKIKRSVHTLADTAIIVVPAEASVLRNGKTVLTKCATTTIFKPGDKVMIDLGYNGENNREFTGFVKEVDSNMPTRIVCEGYAWQQKQANVSNHDSEISLEDLLKKTIGNLPVNYQPAFEILGEMIFDEMIADEVSVFKVLQDIIAASGENLTAFFRGEALCCGLICSAYSEGKALARARKVKYELGQNTVRYDRLRLHERRILPGQIKYFRKLVTGETITGTFTSGFGNGIEEKKSLNKVADKRTLEMVAYEKGLANTYDGLEGAFETFLQPMAEPGDICAIVSEKRPELNGEYLVVSTEVRFGQNGARRIVEPGIRVGTAKRKGQ